MAQPIQPLALDEHGVLRFKGNAIVQYLLDNGGLDMNDLCMVPCSQEDREQFAQLIGYSLSGFGDLSYASDATYDAADKMYEEGLSEKDARIATLEETVETVRSNVKDAAAALFRIHPDDLHT